MEQIVKLTGRIAEVFPAQSGVSARTGNNWMSQDYLFEFFQWSGQQNPNRLVARIFGEDNIKRHHLKALEENVTLTLRLDASQPNNSGRWFNEVRITNVERAGQQQPAQSPQPQDGCTGAAPAAAQSGTGAAPQAQASNGSDDLPF